MQLGSFFKAGEKSGTRNGPVDLDLNLTHPNIRGVQGVVAATLEVMPEKEALDDEQETGRTADIMTREGKDGPMYTYYRPPGAFPAFGLMAIFMAKIKAMRNYCIGCCCLLILAGGGAAVAMS